MFAIAKKTNFEEIMQIVVGNDKQRFQVMEEEGMMYIRAVQGHTIKTINDEELLEEIKDPFFYEEVVHGTYLKCIEPILKTGLCKMARNHIRKYFPNQKQAKDYILRFQFL